MPEEEKLSVNWLGSIVHVHHKKRLAISDQVAHTISALQQAVVSAHVGHASLGLGRDMYLGPLGS